MLILLSPAKTLDFESPVPVKRHTKAEFLETSETLVKQMRKLKSADLQNIMGVSEKIADMNVERFKYWRPPVDLKSSKQALYAFQGDVYQGLDAESFTTSEVSFAQKHLRILSGLYGLLRPLDLIQPYRLEMGTRFEFNGKVSLYEVWSDDITQKINKELRSDKNELLINLASNEYFKVVNLKTVKGQVVTPVFKDEKNGQFKIISFYAKKARGLMAAWIIRNQIKDTHELNQFDIAGYSYSKAESTEVAPVFLRKETAR